MFIFSAGSTFLFSTLFHLFYEMSCGAKSVFQRLDYAGICVLIFGSTVPIYYYSFFCQPFLIGLYLGILGFFSISVFIACMIPAIHTNKYLGIKSIMFGTFGISAAIGLPHLAYNAFTMTAADGQIPMGSITGYVLLEGFFYLGGLTLYFFKFPENLYPGRFDLIVRSPRAWCWDLSC